MGRPMIAVLTTVAIALVSLVGVLAFRWFRAYRYTDAWRKGEFRAAALGFLVFFGGLFGHRLPPPPEARIESTSSAPRFPEEIADKEP